VAFCDAGCYDITDVAQWSIHTEKENKMIWDFFKGLLGSKISNIQIKMKSKQMGAVVKAKSAVSRKVNETLNKGVNAVKEKTKKKEKEKEEDPSKDA
jgi:hypothetical protein